jgi:para-nitrobenzyl esterase
VRPATAWSAIIPQPVMGVPGGVVDGVLAQNETDALTINVWTPAADAGKRPVMVWVSCGAFTFSSGADPFTDGERLARTHDVVVATFNCRPGLLGFLYLGDVLGGEYTAGNAGLLDQVSALEWVQDNIAAFGGDPDNVTVFGCSGSGFSIAALMSMPIAKGLFRRAIVESGSDFASNERHHSSEYTEHVLAVLGIAGNPDALFDVTPEQLMAVKITGAGSLESGYGATRGGPVPVVDKVTLPAQPLVAWASGSADQVDLIIGSNLQEMNIQLPEGLSEDAIRGILPRAVEEPAEIVETMALSCDGLNVRTRGVLRASTLVEGYRKLESQRSLGDLLNFLRSELLFRIPATRMAEAQIAGSGRPVYQYLFSWGTGAHGLEVGFVFDNLDKGLLGDMSQIPGAQALADAMSASWAAFARTGDPSQPLVGDWPRYSVDGRDTMVFDDPCRVERDPYGEHRLLWHGVPLGNRTLLATQALRVEIGDEVTPV